MLPHSIRVCSVEGSDDFGDCINTSMGVHGFRSGIDVRLSPLVRLVLSGRPSADCRLMMGV